MRKGEENEREGDGEDTHMEKLSEDTMNLLIFYHTQANHAKPVYSGGKYNRTCARLSLSLYTILLVFVMYFIVHICSLLSGAIHLERTSL